MLDSVKEAEVRKTADFQVTPSGEFAVFSTTQPLTDYENAGYSEIYRYDAGLTGNLTCASCDPTNADAPATRPSPPTASASPKTAASSSTPTDALVPRAADKENVYEWEPGGTGTCHPKAQTTLLWGATASP